MIKIVQTLKFAILLIILFNIDSFAQWQWLHPNPTGVSYNWCKMWDANIFYVAGQGGYFLKTTNGGANWEINSEASALNSSVYGTIFDAHFFDQSTGILVGKNGATKTTNGGGSFIPISSLNNNDINDIFFLNSDTGYVCGNNAFLQKTTDGGDTWMSVTTSFSGNYFGINTFNDTDIFIVGSFIGSSSGNMLRSSDGGTSWEEVITGGSELIYNIEFLNSDTAIITGNGLFKISTDAGMTWGSNTIPPMSSPVSAFTSIKNISTGPNQGVYITGTHEPFIIKTTNLGISWDTLSMYPSGYSELSRNWLATSFSTSGDTIFGVGYFGLMSLRESNDITWLLESVRYGMINLAGRNNNGIYAIGNKLWVVGEPQKPGVTFDQILYSSDAGATWSFQSTASVDKTLIEIDMVNDLFGYVVGEGGVVLKTSNGGVNWESLNSPTNFDLRDVDFINENTGWIIGTDTVCYKTTNGGLNWIYQKTGLGGGLGLDHKGISMINENTGWVVGQNESQVDDGTFKTTNGGLNWFNQGSNEDGQLSSIKMVNDSVGFLCGVFTIRKTLDGGNSWDSIPQPLNTFYIDVDALDEMNVAIVGFSFGIHSTDGGESWEISHGINAGNFATLKMVLPESKGSLVYATGNGAGVLKYGDGVVSIGTTHWYNENPNDFVLKQNYPNPFNPVTTIEFSIPIQSKVTLKVYDTSGREVKTLINDLPLNRGVVKQTFDGSNFASGVYFYSLLIDGKSIETKKMILVK